MDEAHAKLIEKARKEYKKIGSIACPAFNEERVYFNAHGFNHLIRKGRISRTKSEQIRRIYLVPQAVIMISTETKIHVYRKTTVKQSTGHFWTLKRTSFEEKIQVVIRQLNDGKKHFFSVM